MQAHTTCTLLCLASLPQHNVFEIHACCINSSFFFIAAQHFIVEICHNLFISLLINIWVLLVFNLNIFVQVILWTYHIRWISNLVQECTYWYVCNFIRSYPRAFQSGCTKMYSHQENVSIAIAHHLRKFFYCQ